MKVNDIIIRKATEKDLDAIGGLFPTRKDDSQLRWPLSSDINDNTLNSFVAVTEENRIVGHIGYVVSHYLYNESEWMGTYPILWIVSSDYRGSGIGKRLMNSVIDAGDISILFGGAEIARSMTPIFGFITKLKIFTYFKILNPIGYFQSSGDSFQKKTAKALILCYNSSKRIKYAPFKQGIRLEEYSGGGIARDLAKNNVFHNNQHKTYIDWILRCPFVNSYAFTIKRNNDDIGMAICFMNRNKKGTIAGRIVHLSYLGDDLNVWRQVLANLEAFFREKGCSSISTLVSHPIYSKSLKDLGYATFKNSYLPFYLVDRKNVCSHIPDDFWHLTYVEGDLCPRGI